MDFYLPLVLAALTSLVTYWLARRGFGWSRTGLRHAVAWTLEAVRLTLAFLVLDLAAGVVAIALLRTLTGRFVSLYLLDDTTWFGLALLQALVFQRWREAR